MMSREDGHVNEETWPRPTGHAVSNVADVADVCVVRDSTRIEPSREFVAAVERLRAPAQAVVRRLLEVGFQNVIQK